MFVGKVNTRQTARTLTIPAPIGGLNGRDGLAAMPPNDAYLLDNWFPGTATVDSRGGNVEAMIGLGSEPVESLEPYNGGAVSKMLAFTGGFVFEQGEHVTGLVANGNMSDGVVGWTAGGGATLTSENGRLRVTNGANGTASQAIPTEIGRSYKFTYSSYDGTGPARVKLGTAAGLGDLLDDTTDAENETITFVATTALTHVTLQVDSAVALQYAEFDRIILNEILQTGRNGNRIVSTMFSNAGDQFMLGVSGEDVPFSFDGDVITNLVLTGLTGGATADQLSHVFAYKGRVYWAAAGQLGFYYLPVGQIQGALSYFDLSQIARKGGYLVAMASFSADSGDGPNDYAVFITSMGEYLVYAGFDPANAANWTLVGRYYSAPPIGRRCTLNYGSDLIILTIEGALPFSAVRREGGIVEDDAITYKLGRFLLDKNQYAEVYGWDAVLYPRGGMLVINVPTGPTIGDDYVQFVQNTSTKAWTRFNNLNGICWCEFRGRLYFGKFDGRVMLADEGALDDGQPINLDCKQAYNYFEDGNGTGPANKHFHFAKLLLGCDGNPPLNAQFNVDYLEDQPDYVAAPPDEGSYWDISTWDVASWGTDLTTRFVMLSMGKYGVAGSLWLRASLQGLSLKWYATQYIFSKAAGVL